MKTNADQLYLKISISKYAQEPLRCKDCPLCGFGNAGKNTDSKAAYIGSKVVLVDPKYTSQMCSRCWLRKSDRSPTL